jgi:multimeric flavodoxin WrbA
MCISSIIRLKRDRGQLTIIDIRIRPNSFICQNNSENMEVSFMKLLGLSSGRKMGSCEIMLKEALMGAEEKGATVEFVRLYDLDIRSCRFCNNCLRVEGGPSACVVKDDVPFMWEKFMDCDGIIIAAPIYILAIPGYLKLLADRMIQDLAGVMMAKNMGNISPMTGNKVYIDERAFRKRVSAFISVGGAVTPNWVSLGLPLMHCITFPKQLDLVDQMQVLSVSTVLGAVVANEKTLKELDYWDKMSRWR